MLKRLGKFYILVLITVVSGCASLNSGYEKPEIHLVSIKPLPSANLEQRFLLGLRIINPNNVSLPVTGFSYHLSLQGHKVLTGVSSSIAEIPAFGNQLVELNSSTSLLGGIGVIREMLSHPNQPFEYAVTVKIHSSWWQLPITVVESGEIDLGN